MANIVDTLLKENFELINATWEKFRTFVGQKRMLNYDPHDHDVTCCRLHMARGSIDQTVV